jgi:hypothetical protein
MHFSARASSSSALSLFERMAVGMAREECKSAKVTRQKESLILPEFVVKADGGGKISGYSICFIFLTFAKHLILSSRPIRETMHEIKHLERVNV